MLHRISLLAAVVMAALAISVTPALAGEDDGNPVTPPVTVPTPAPVPPPAPATPAPAPTPAPKKAPKKAPKANSGGSKSGKSNSSKSKSSKSSQTVRPYTPVVQQTYTIPQGGIQAGAGGTAPQDSGSMLPIGLGLIGLTLGAAGAFTLRRRYVTE